MVYVDNACVVLPGDFGRGIGRRIIHNNDFIRLRDNVGRRANRLSVRPRHASSLCAGTMNEITADRSVLLRHVQGSTIC